MRTKNFSGKVKKGNFGSAISPMKTLILLRHAKSSWKDPYLSDHDRPLNKRGKRDAPLMARVYKRHFSTPDLIMCSSSERTKATANAFIQELGVGIEKLEYERDLYHADAFEMLRIISLVDSGVNTLLVIGHNPGITILARIDAEYTDLWDGSV